VQGGAPAPVAGRSSAYSTGGEQQRSGASAAPNYHFAERHPRDLIIAGPTLFGASYLLALGVGVGQGLPNQTGFLIAPVFGPWLTLATRHRAQSCDPFCESASTHELLTNLFLVLNGTAQAAGAAVFVYALATTERVYVPDDTARIRLAPAQIGGTGYGAALSGTF